MATTAQPKTGLDAYVVDEYEPNCCCPFNNPEAAGFVMAKSLPSGVTVMANIFLSAAVLEMANRAAGCDYLYDEDDDDPKPCKGMVYGMRPASLYLLMTAVAGFTVAVVNPIFGAIVDNTRFRKHVAGGALLFLGLVQLCQAVITEATWFFVLALQIPAICAAFAHSVASSAYLPELSNVQKELNTAGSYATLYLFSTQVAFVLIVIAVAIPLLDDDSVKTAQLSQSLCGLVLLYTSTHIYGRLMRGRELPPIGLCEAIGKGMFNLKSTWSEMTAEFPAVRRYLIGAMFAEASMEAFPSVAATYLVTQLGASGSTLSVIIVALLIFGAAFSPLANTASKWAGAKYGDVWSGHVPLIASIVWLTLVTEAAPFAMRTRQDLPVAFIFAALWGAGMGPYYSLLKPVYFFIVPGGQEVKYAGLFSLAQVIISWAPLLAFTVAYEQTGSLAGGFHCMGAFLVVGGGLIASIDMEEARKTLLKSGTLEARSKAMGQGVEGSQPAAGGVELKGVTNLPKQGSEV